MKKQLLTLCLVYQPPRLLLAMKKKGFGAGNYNGFGGKVEDGESIDAAAGREFLEEAGIPATKIEKRGIIEFEFKEKPNKFDSLEVHIYSAEILGEPKETDEMRPQWFDVSELTEVYKKMWKADEKWIPLFLHGKKFKGKFYYTNADNKELLSYGLDVVDRLE